MRKVWREPRGAGSVSADFDVLCLSHLRWDFVHQRPHHLMSRFARDRRVFFVEEPEFDADAPRLTIGERANGVRVVVPHLSPLGADDELRVRRTLRQLLDELLAGEGIANYVLWYYTPMALQFSRHLQPDAIVYDCMDELSAFNPAPATIRQLESELFRRADLVFTGGHSLYESKRRRHDATYCFPSSVDVRHFARGREPQPEPADQASITHPRIGFFGVIDERMDLALLTHLADSRPEWQVVMIGPIADSKLDPAALPRRSNIHYLGAKAYDDLPAYLSGWDVAMMPFARNESTRFISPTKTPEYLAAGRPVISTAVADVVRPYGEQGLVHIADSADSFVAAIEAALAEEHAGEGESPVRRGPSRLDRVDSFLADMSWDRTWAEMNALVEEALSLPPAAPVEHTRAAYSGTNWESMHV